MTPVFTGNVLIVEDNFIIAMDTQELVADLGATSSQVANSCNDALALLDEGCFTAAILDFNLSDETSVRIADALEERDIPFVFATGYSDASVLPERYRDTVMLKKPYLQDDIRAAFAALKDSGADG
ncbi:response regulator [Algimonas porphyrae]|uniref:Response regulator n=1 Tax=Algimonas porphyrae TaxID=1128113 RepID=A0ABQ5V495_9PROT|nr:response regulator [Algimonas porphyrae]GLQ21097.1 response regulator [Algimonas porphyrae]